MRHLARLTNTRLIFMGAIIFLKADLHFYQFNYYLIKQTNQNVTVVRKKMLLKDRTLGQIGQTWFSPLAPPPSCCSKQSLCDRCLT